MAHHFRDAIAADDVALAEIYGHYVSTTVVTFDIVEVTPEIIAVISDDGADASIHLHKKLGFESIGHLTRVGYKFDRWVGTYLMQKSIDA